MDVNHLRCNCRYNQRELLLSGATAQYSFHCGRLPRGCIVNRYLLVLFRFYHPWTSMVQAPSSVLLVAASLLAQNSVALRWSKTKRLLVGGLLTTKIVKLWCRKCISVALRHIETTRSAFVLSPTYEQNQHSTVQLVACTR